MSQVRSDHLSGLVSLLISHPPTQRVPIPPKVRLLSILHHQISVRCRFPLYTLQKSWAVFNWTLHFFSCTFTTLQFGLYIFTVYILHFYNLQFTVYTYTLQFSNFTLYTYGFTAFTVRLWIGFKPSYSFTNKSIASNMCYFFCFKLKLFLAQKYKCIPGTFGTKRG